MMAYVALYRQWRPQDFDNLIGQEPISTTLKNAINTGKIAHAYLFAGPRGTGKTSTAKILAKTLNCAEGPTDTPCNRCANCERINAGTSMDVFEIDAASNRGIDEIRDLREAVKFAPVDARYKVYIIDEVHMLTTEAFNALLKTLEEPPAHVVFVLATTEPHKIPATIHSRCQRYDFRRIAVSEIERRLNDVAQKSELDVTAEALHMIAVHADGSMRDALSILDQCTTVSDGAVVADAVRNLLGLVGHDWVWKLTDAVADRDAAAVMLLLDEIIALGKDVRQILLEVALHGRSLMLYKAVPDFKGAAMYSEDKDVLAKQSSKFTYDEIVGMIQAVQLAANEAKWAAEPRITLEMAMLALCRRTGSEGFEALAERVKTLEMAVLARSTLVEALPVKTQNVSKVQSPQSLRRKPETVNDKPAIEKPDVTLGVSSDGKPEEIWEAVLKDLIASGKRSVHACLAQGRIAILNDSQVTVEFASLFAKERSEKEDYCNIIEKILARILGRQIRLHCVLATAQPVISTKASGPAAPGGEDNKVHPAVEAAIKIFGGRAIKEEKNGEE
ncbi:MAG: dnaX [Firmicutes bacterium]|nr:dnaX [Bacillota bacterium]